MAVVLLAGAAWLSVKTVRKQQLITLRGAVIRQDTDPGKQVPVGNAIVFVIADSSTAEVRSDQTGLFTVILPQGVRRGDPVVLRFSHPDYYPLQLNESVSDALYIARLIPTTKPAQKSSPSAPERVISNMRVRYMMRSTEVADVGSEVKTFQVANTGDVACEKQLLCSPDGRWKAAAGSLSLDAGEGNQFRNVRVSCIAGPCAFTSIDRQNVSADGRHLDITARTWSDTATFLVEAEVAHTAEVDLVRESYPAIFGPSFSFSLPASSEGPSILAEVNHESIVFPLSPDLSITWAQCTEGKVNDRITAYHCELLPGYRFQ